MTNTTCSELTDNNILDAGYILKSCAKFYHSGDLANSCQGMKMKSLHENNSLCCHKNYVYDIFHFFTDENFLSKNHSSNTFLTFTMSYLHVCTDVVTFYRNNIEYAYLGNDHVQISGVDIGPSKASLFSDYLIQDLMYFGIAMLLIIIIMCFYLRSLTITIATVLNVIFSFLLAYFIYHVVFRLTFFPFMNVLSALVLIAIGADDVFIFYDTWFQMNENTFEITMEDLLSQTFHHAILSIFITSVTTSAAFISNVASSITAIKCFGIFSGIAILVNFIMMMTWIPSVFVIWYRSKFKLCQKICSGDSCISFIKKVTRYVALFFEKTMPFLILKGSPAWICIFTLLGAGGIILVFVQPRLNLPSSREFQLFASHTPIEKYEQDLKHRFRCVIEDLSRQPGIDIHIVWGVKALDNGNWLDPRDHGWLVQDKHFDLTQPNTVQWLADFCDVIRNQSFVNTSSLQWNSCLMQSYIDEVTSPCTLLSRPCCNLSLPLQNLTLLNMCLYRTHINTLHSKPLGTPYFDFDNQMKAFEIIVQSSQVLSPSFKEMDSFFGHVEQFVSYHIINAPKGLETGWFIGLVDSGQYGGNLDFYDLQIALSSGTFIAIGISLAFAGGVMFITSLNIVITLFAMVNITLSIFSTIGALVLLGWELNIVESVTLSLGVGLSIDFSIHYGMAYRMSKEHQRHLRIEESLRSVGAAVTMAALTTFLAGAAVMPSRIVSYTQLGVFLMLVMFFSWTFSTFLFQSLCAVCGPQGNCGQIPLVCAEGNKCRCTNTCVVTTTVGKFQEKRNALNKMMAREVHPL